MMNLITGIPGSGKTYLAVHFLVDQYFFWHRKDQAFYRKKSADSKYVIITNITDLRLPGIIQLETLFADTPFDKFFSYDYQEKIHKKYPYIVYVLDEIHDYMPVRYSNTEVIKYFSKHRHFGDRVFLITQDYQMISKAIYLLVDIEYRAVSATFSLGRMRYNLKSKGEKFTSKSLPRDKKIYSIYKSFEGGDQEKVRNPIKYYALLLILAFFGFGYLFYSTLYKTDEKKTVQTLSPAPIVKQTQIHKETTSTQNISDRIPPVDINQLFSVPIDGWVEKEDGLLYMFIDLFSHKPIKPHESRYPVKKFQSAYYAILSLAEYSQLQQINHHFSSSSSTIPSPNQ